MRVGTALGQHDAALVRTSTNEDHAILTYDSDAQLTVALAQFVAAGFLQGDRMIVIATPEHTDAIRTKLTGLFDIDGAVRSGQLVVRDANEVLASLLVDGRPTSDRFDATVGRLVEEVRDRAPGTRLRAFGEMVDLLCRAGAPEAALELEELWHRLLGRLRFWLVCVYANEALNDLGPAWTHRLLGIHGASSAPRGGRASDASPLYDVWQQRRDTLRERARKDDTTSFRLLVESVIDYAIFMLDPSGVITSWNAGAERIKGYTADEIIGQHFSTFYSSAEVASGKCDYELEVASKEGRFLDEGWRLRKDGTRFWASVVITALRDANGKHVGFAKVTRDLTERREAEEARLRLAQEQDANRAKDDFLATVSHELRNPLHSILGWASLLAQELTDPSTKKAATTILRNAEAQARLIDDLLDISRIVAGKLELDLGAADLFAIVKDAVEVVRPKAAAKGLALTLESNVQSAPLLADATRLYQILANLLSNALKFTDEGSIHVELVHRGTSVELSVRDTGRGIEPEFLPHIFERFSQSETTRILRSGGLGLGLSIVQHLVVLHGGTVAVESKGPGKGSLFKIALPVRSIDGIRSAHPQHESERAAT